MLVFKKNANTPARTFRLVAQSGRALVSKTSGWGFESSRACQIQLADVKVTTQMVNRIRNYLRGVRSEFGKISWPTRGEVIALTVLVLAMVIILTVYIGAIDALLQQVIKFLIRT